MKIGQKARNKKINNIVYVLSKTINGSFYRRTHQIQHGNSVFY